MPNPMFFNEPLVRQRVLNGLPTVTVRSSPSHKPKEVVHGSLFFPNRTGVIINTRTVADAYIDEISTFGQYVHESGFESVHDWIVAIKRQHNPKETQLLYIIKVQKM